MNLNVLLIDRFTFGNGGDFIIRLIDSIRKILYYNSKTSLQYYLKYYYGNF